MREAGRVNLPGFFKSGDKMDGEKAINGPGFDEVSGVLLGRLLQRVDTLIEDNKSAERSRKGQYERLELIATSIFALDKRVEAVEKELTAHGPTLAEFVQMKQRIQAAGFVGRSLWLTGGFLLGTAAWIIGARENVAHWLLQK